MENSCGFSGNQLFEMEVKDENEIEENEASIVTDEMSNEEKELEMKSSKEWEIKRREYEAQQYEKEIKETRYNRLLNLLEKSQFYANFIQSQMQRSLQEQKENEKPNERRKRRKEKMLHEEECKILNAASKKMKLQSSQSSSNSLTYNQSTHSQQLNEKLEKTKITPLGITVPCEQPDLLEGGCLRDYQIDGFKWLKMLFEGGINGILADEMGIGKTLQAIALLCHLYEQGIPGPFIIIAPLSTLPNWLTEFNKFAPRIPVVLYHGNEAERLKLRGSITKLTNIAGKPAAPVVITSYQVPINDAKYLRLIQWKYLIVDEGQRLKNFENKLFRTLMTFRSVNKLLLTGTPLQNNLKELWSLLHFLIPDIFDNLDVFESWFVVEDIDGKEIASKFIKQEQENKILTVLHQILSPFLLRRVKADVKLNLPGKKEVHVLCPMSELQLAVYQSLIDNGLKYKNKEEKNLVLPDNPDGTKRKRNAAIKARNKISLNRLNKGKIPHRCYETNEIIETEVMQNYKNNLLTDNFESNNILMKYEGVVYSFSVKINSPHIALKKVANHPMLLLKEVELDDEVLARRSEGNNDDLITASGKLIILGQLLSKLKERGHKVLLFSTWTRVLDIIEDNIGHNIEYRRLDGNTKLEGRREAIYSFNTDPNIFLFLISNKAGGLGINLTSADTAIIFDSDWNPQNDLQAQDRCHRIGQTRPVVVYRLISSGSIDEKIVSRASSKRKLEKMIIEQGEFKGHPGRRFVDLEELKELLLKNQHSHEVQADSKSGVLSEEEWEKLLDRQDMKIS